MRVFLIGFMGAGKSYWADRWANRSGMTALDLDLLIEQTEGKSIGRIFEEHGEDYFRAAEAKKMREVGEQEEIILACGGGTPCFHHNLDWMKSKGKLVYLRANMETILSRLQEAWQQRPLLVEKNTEIERIRAIEVLMEERYFYYSQADHVFQVEELTDDVIFRILDVSND